MSTPTLSAPTFPAGPVEHVVGNRRFWLPRASRVANVLVDRRQLSYVLTPAKTLHALTQAGEIAIPDEVREHILGKYFPDE